MGWSERGGGERRCGTGRRRWQDYCHGRVVSCVLRESSLLFSTGGEEVLVGGSSDRVKERGQFKMVLRAVCAPAQVRPRALHARKLVERSPPSRARDGSLLSSSILAKHSLIVSILFTVHQQPSHPSVPSSPSTSPPYSRHSSLPLPSLPLSSLNSSSYRVQKHGLSTSTSSSSLLSAATSST